MERERPPPEEDDEEGEGPLDPQEAMESMLEPLRAGHVRLLRPTFLLKWYEKHGGKTDTPRKRASELLTTQAEALPFRVDVKSVRRLFDDFSRNGDEINELSGLIDVEEIVDLLFVQENEDAYHRVPRWMLLTELRKHGCTPMPHRRALEDLQNSALGRQQLKELGGDAFVDVASMTAEEAKALQVVSVSYCWLHPDHPDPNLFHLATLDKLIRCFMKGTFKRAKAKTYLGKPKEHFQRRGFCFGAGDGRPIGIFWDWCSLYQDRPTNSRSGAELMSFQAAMPSVTTWYTHKRSIVWLLNHLPSDQGKTPCEPFHDRNGNIITSLVRANYGKSGWPTLERFVASVLKHPGDLLDITFALRSRLMWLAEKEAVSDGIEPQFFDKDPQTGELPKDKQGEAILRESKDHKAFVADQLNRPLCRAYTKGDYLKLSLDMMCKERILPIAPAQFDALIDQKQFALRADASVVKPMYRGAFEAIIATAPSLRFSNLRLGDSVVRPFLGVVSAHCRHLVDLDMSDNEITVPLEEWAAALCQLPTLRKLDLSWNSWLGGNIRALSGLKALRSLALYDCLKVKGDVRGLSGLTTLENLNLTNTGVDGNLKGLATLLGVESLKLRGCKVTGNMEELQVLSKLTVLDLPYDGVDGDLKALRASIPGLKEAMFPAALPGAADAQESGERVLTQSERVLAAMAAAEAEAAKETVLASSASAPAIGSGADRKKPHTANDDDPYSDSDDDVVSLPPVEKPLPWPLNEPPGMFAVKDPEHHRPLLNFSFPKCAPGLPDLTGRLDMMDLEKPTKRRIYHESTSLRINKGGMFS